MIDISAFLINLPVIFLTPTLFKLKSILASETWAGAHPLAVLVGPGTVVPPLFRRFR